MLNRIKKVREWWNWQTRTFEGRVSLTYGFKSRLSHHFLLINNYYLLIINCKSGSGGTADAPDSGSGAFTGVWVQIPSPAPDKFNPNPCAVLVRRSDFIIFYHEIKIKSRV